MKTAIQSALSLAFWSNEVKQEFSVSFHVNDLCTAVMTVVNVRKVFWIPLFGEIESEGIVRMSLLRFCLSESSWDYFRNEKVYLLMNSKVNLL